MLGKVFEEMVTGRHDSGAYYTSRPVVAFMCREALKGYLEGKNTGLNTDAIARVVDEHDTSAISPTAARDISKTLTDVTVVDESIAKLKTGPGFDCCDQAQGLKMPGISRSTKSENRN